jgi:hypothetical protein
MQIEDELAEALNYKKISVVELKERNFTLG